MEELEKGIYHITDTLKHKMGIMECLVTYISNYENKNCIMQIINNFIKFKSVDIDDELLGCLINNTINNINSYGFDKFDMEDIIYTLSINIMNHDNSKLMDSREYDMYKNVVYKLDGLEHGTKEHKEAIAELNSGFEIHATNNDHHPEYFCGTQSIYDDNLVNIRQMDLFNIMEMLLDWCSAAICRGFKFRLSSVENKKNKLELSDEVAKLFIDNIKLMLDKDHIDDDI